MRLQDKRTIITGAGSGIGREVARRFVQEGARVALLDLDAGALGALAGELGDGIVATAAADVTDGAAVRAAVAEAVSALGGLDVVVNNAGIPMVGAVRDLAEEDWDRALAVDLKSVFLVSQAAWPHLEAAGGGVIASTASIAGQVGTAGQAAYATAKAGVIMLTRCMALEGAAAQIRVNAVNPGFVATPMLERYLAEQDDPAAARTDVEAMHPLGRLGEPRDIADAFVYLASDEARWVTGTTLAVDGGFAAGAH
ncbi:SDR family oxidoreductase [Baekduia soli]|uniref:SDR family oxidoreductase n=2 Tax=Baekduia soli TaxID=496014 RepID=A0A5B8UC43_9ACTN|nr:SDR family oxidoreductase [Baekduia soli]